MLSPLDYTSAKADGAVNGGRKAHSLAVDWLSRVCYLFDKLEVVFINQYLFHTYHQQVQYWHYAFLQVPKTVHYLLKHFP